MRRHRIRAVALARQNSDQLLVRVMFAIIGLATAGTIVGLLQLI